MADICIKCGHVKLNPWREHCQHEVSAFGKRPIRYCGCHCVFQSIGEQTMSTKTGTPVAPVMDWQQVVLNGGPPCFYVEDGKYCGRAERWEGHGVATFHDYVSLDAALARERADEREFAVVTVNDYLNLSGKQWVAKYGMSYNVGGLTSVLILGPTKDNAVWGQREVLIAKERADTWAKAVDVVKQMKAENDKNYEYWKSVASEPSKDFGVLKWVAWGGEDERVVTTLEAAARAETEGE